ncbi:MAG: AI-2E family transporter [Actinomycetota bacterium]
MSAQHPAIEPTDGPQPAWIERWPPPSYWVRVSVAVGLTLFVLSRVRDAEHVVILLLVAIVLAVGMDPAVRILSRRVHMRRGLAVLTIFILAFAAMTLFAFLVIPPLISQITELAKSIPHIAGDLSNAGGPIDDLIGSDKVQQEIQSFVDKVPSLISSSFGSILGITGKIAGAIFNVLTLSILTIYFMLMLPKMRSGAALLFARPRRAQAERIMDRSIQRIGGYVSSMVVLSVVTAIVTGVVLELLGVPYAVPLALWAGIASVIPVVGAYIGGVPAIAVAFSGSTFDGIAAIAFFLVWQQVRDYVISPRIQGDSVDLSAAAVVVATLIGGSIEGFLGVLLALPIAATLKVVINDVFLDRRRREAEADADAGADASDGIATDPAAPDTG